MCESIGKILKSFVLDLPKSTQDFFFHCVLTDMEEVILTDRGDGLL